ncbi:MAG: ECF-type sigma factor [marine benthic group bacterium]|nr:ECF-type sigma factor [Gemmatimonadota bacterium]
MNDRRAEESAGEVTRLLHGARAGDPDALSKAYELIYAELRGIAASRLQREKAGHTLQPTALVNEAYMKLAGSPANDLEDRRHFIGIAARAMRQVLVDHARRRDAAKRGDGVSPATLTGRVIPAGDTSGPDPEELLALDAALDRLDEREPRLRRVVELRYFGGLNDSEIGALLGVTRRTVQRDWTRARAWLHAELYPSRSSDGRDPDRP